MIYKHENNQISIINNHYHIPFHMFGIDRADLSYIINVQFKIESNLILLVELKSFTNTYQVKHMIELNENKNSIISTFLKNTLLSGNMKIVIEDNLSFKKEKIYTLNKNDKMLIQYFFEDLIHTNTVAGLKDALHDTPEKLLIPYSKPNFFSMLCKLPNTLFEEIQFIEESQFFFHVKSTDEYILFTLHANMHSLGFIYIERNGIDTEIQDDFNELIQTQKVEFFISSSELIDYYTRTVTISLNLAQLKVIDAFFN